jgi:hypothetical protein
MVSFLKNAISLASNYLSCLIQGLETNESLAPCTPGSCNHSQSRAISIEEFEIMHVSNQSLNSSSCIDTPQNEICVLEVEGQSVILCRHVKYVKHENGHDITCMEFEKYMISKEDLEQTSYGTRLLVDWEDRKRGKATRV